MNEQPSSVVTEEIKAEKKGPPPSDPFLAYLDQFVPIAPFSLDESTREFLRMIYNHEDPPLPHVSPASQQNPEKVAAKHAVDAEREREGRPLTPQDPNDPQPYKSPKDTPASVPASSGIAH